MRIILMLIVLMCLCVSCNQDNNNQSNDPLVHSDPWLPPTTEDNDRPGDDDDCPFDINRSYPKNDSYRNQQPIPEPSTFIVFGSGLALIGLINRRKRKKNGSFNEGEFS